MCLKGCHSLFARNQFCSSVCDLAQEGFCWSNNCQIKIWTLPPGCYWANMPSESPEGSFCTVDSWARFHFAYFPAAILQLNHIYHIVPTTKVCFHKTQILSEQSSGAGDRMPSLAPRDPPRMGSGAIFLSSHTILVTGIQQSPQEWGQVSLTILVNWRAVKRRRESQTKPSYRHRMFLKSKLERKEIHIRVVIISPPKKY